MDRTQYAHGEFCWVDLAAADMQAAKSFYGELFGWEAQQMETSGPPYATFLKDGKSVAGLGQLDDGMKAAGVPPMWNSYINVDDIDAVMAKAGPLGAETIFPKMPAEGAGWLAGLKDPTGAPVMLWQKQNHFGAQLCNAVGSFCWNELATRDTDAAMRFFGELLGWKYDKSEASEAPYWMIVNGERMNGGLMSMSPEFGEAPPHWSTYFNVADVQASSDKVKALGGQVMFGPFPTPAGSMTVCADHQGAVFSLIQAENPDS